MPLIRKILCVLTLAFAVPTVLMGLAASGGMRSIERQASEEATVSLHETEVRELAWIASEHAREVEVSLGPLSEDVRLLRLAWESMTAFGGRRTDEEQYPDTGLPGFPRYGRVHPVYGAYADFERLGTGSPWVPRFAMEAARRDPATARRLGHELDRVMLLTPMLRDVSTRHADLVDLAWIVLVDGAANAQPPYDYATLPAGTPGIANVVEAEEAYVRSVGPVANPERATRWLEPYFDAFKGLWMTSCVAPLYDRERFVGSVGLDVPLSTMTARCSGWTTDRRPTGSW